MKVIWLGQSGYVFESEGKRLLIDPFYSDIVEQLQGLKRLMLPPIPMEELRPDVIFITHNHIDHFDPIALPEIHKLYPSVPIAGPESVMKKAKEMGFDEKVLTPMPRGTSQMIGPFGIKTVAAYHSDPFSVGCLIETEGKCFYYSGDTLLTDTLFEEITASANLPIEAVFIVINGRLGNMNVQEAIELTVKLKPCTSIPMHYGMFAENTEDPQVFLNGCAAKGINAIEVTLGNEHKL